ncbi:MAG: hypothetical protein M0Q16_06880 [Candidatus Cloacimonetes bacterium]|nr:hypothetical protein [Candidatus Cloacimonadota bacterium]
MKPLKAVIELDISRYGTVQAEKLLRIFIGFFRECTTFKGGMRGYIVYDETEEVIADLRKAKS